jgi:diguanylate cyclase (GGDEF)-like protein
VQLPGTYPKRWLPRSPSALVLALGVVWVVLLGTGVLGSAEASTFAALGAVAVITTITGLRWYRPALRWPWWCICAALVLFLVGGAAREQLGTLGDLSTHRSLIPDAITIPGYVALALALGTFGHARRRGRSGDVDAILDATVAALAALSLAWVFLIGPVVHGEVTTLSTEIVIAVYPALSVFLVALCARIAFSPQSRRVVAYQLVFAAMGMMLLGDVVYMFVDTGVISIPGSLTDVPYALAFVFCATCTLHPSMRQLSEPIPPGEVAPSNRRLAFVAGALAVPAVVAVTQPRSTAADRLVLASIIAALTVTASARVLRALRAHARSEADLAYQATHDALTRLPNRLAAETHLEHLAADAVTRGKQAALLFLDLDRFKLLNDTMGHSAGDELLVDVAERLQQSVPEGALIARVGGDEFLIVIDTVTSIETVLDDCERIRVAIEAPFALRGNHIYTSVSIGVALASGDALAVNAEAMIREADTAMYQAKDAGRNSVSVFDASMRDRVTERLTLERDLHVALDRREFEVHYQPIVQLPAGPVEGFEALVRWSHPTRGVIGPDKFIPIAEDSGLIGDIGSWVLEEACHRLRLLRIETELADDLYVSVNLSARQLRDPLLAGTVRRVLDHSHLEPGALCLELTESVLMDEPTSAVALLQDLRDIGVRLAIDDFGTGYSSLAYAQRFPTQCVKIDRSFVEALDLEDSPEASLVSAIVAMASALKMKTVAEGVETPGQEARLIELGCHAAQGFFYSRPVPDEALAATLHRLTVPVSA